MAEADVEPRVFAPSIVYAPGDPWITLLERLSLLPVMPLSGSRRALYQPIWADDVADCVISALGLERDRAATSSPGPRRSPTTASWRRSCAPFGRRRRPLARAAAGRARRR